VREQPPGPGDLDEAKASLLASVKRYQASHPVLVKEEAKRLGLTSMGKSSEDQIAALLDAVIDRIERVAIAEEGTPPEGATP
jgi:hypothetical protein